MFRIFGLVITSSSFLQHLEQREADLIVQNSHLHRLVERWVSEYHSLLSKYNALQKERNHG